MFDASDTPRVFGVAPGADFPAAIVREILRRTADAPPENLAQALILVNTRRMQRRLTDLFANDGARLLPKIGLVTDLGALVPDAPLPAPMPPLRRRLDLAQLIEALLSADPSLAPRSALFDLADSLSSLLDEMQGEGVGIDAIRAIDTSDISGHWARTQSFLSVVSDYLSAIGTQHADPELLRSLALDEITDRWRAAPPQSPVLVVGSTGSRGTTARLMELVARLPQGAVVLPGFDAALPPETWRSLADQPAAEDHPQYRFAALLARLGVLSTDVITWPADPPSEARNALISLSLRPAPVTNQWREDGPSLGAMPAATADMALIEAPSQREEAGAIASALREAVAQGKTAALITPDRTLGRRVAAALLRWGIFADDSSGRPLNQTAPGRLLRQTARLIGADATSEALIALLKHPLARTGGGDRGQHLLITREFELFLRRKGARDVADELLDVFAVDDPERLAWVAWVKSLTSMAAVRPAPALGECLSLHLRLSEAVAAGPEGTGTGGLWDRQAGRDALAAVEDLAREADSAAPMPLPDYVALFDRVMASVNSRNPDTVRSDVMIWGTLEARVQGADLVILGGLNDGIWPGRPKPDPWLNRRMRQQVGLLLPDRQIGLSAHDYQQAVAARRVILTRALRDDDAETVPSRWLNRLVNLLSGLPEQAGPESLADMRQRGQRYLNIAKQLETPCSTVAPEPRPAPAPPIDVRPTDYSVTDVERLIRDPYHIYARHVLRLRPLNPLRVLPDARLRGTVVHEILEHTIKDGPFEGDDALRSTLMRRADDVLNRLVPWPALRSLWRGRLEDAAEKFAEDEMQRQALGRMVDVEVKGRIRLTDRFQVHGKADRIDRLNDGGMAIYDYKTGQPPSPKQIAAYQKQLLIEAVMLEQDGFQNIAAEPVVYVEYIGLSRSSKPQRLDLMDDGDVDHRTVTVQRELTTLFSEFHSSEKGYPSRRAMESVRWGGDYDHLARFGEWDDTTPSTLIRLP